MERNPEDVFGRFPSMKFLFHSVVMEKGHSKYYNVYKIDDSHFFAECHHFNRERYCEGDFELEKDGYDWKPEGSQHESAAQQIGEEIDRLFPADRD